MKITKDLEMLHKFSERILNLDMAGEYLEHIVKENEGASIEDHLIYIEYLLEALLMEMARISSAKVEQEELIVEWKKGVYKKIVLGPGHDQKVRIWTKKEFEQYINRRAGFDVYPTNS